MIVVLKSTARRQKISGFVSAGGLEFKINFACWNREFNPSNIFYEPIKTLQFIPEWIAGI